VERGVLTGANKQTHRNKIITTTALGSQRLYDFVDENPGVEFWPVSYTNDPRNIAKEDRMVAIDATVRSGLPRPVRLGVPRQRLLVFLRGTTRLHEGRDVRRTRPVFHRAALDDRRRIRLPHRRAVASRAAVTTFKNIVDCVVTEYGVAELRGSSIRERTRKLISIAHPKFREGLMRQAKEMGYS
jgi:acyl-CoA hydrolase